MDLPTGDGTPGGDAIFYVGSLRGDFRGVGFGDQPPDGQITLGDIDGFTGAYQSGNLDADFRGVGFGDQPPDGQITLGDIDGFTAVYQAGLSLDQLPTSLGGAGIASAPVSVEAQDEPVISAASFFYRANKPRSARKADIQLQPVTIQTLNNYRMAKKKALDDEDDSFDVLSLTRLELPLESVA